MVGKLSVKDGTETDVEFSVTIGTETDGTVTDGTETIGKLSVVSFEDCWSVRRLLLGVKRRLSSFPVGDKYIVVSVHLVAHIWSRIS